MREVINYIAAQLSRVAMVTAIVAGITVPALAVHAQAPGICTFGDGKGLRQIVVNGNTATATFYIPNGVNNSCKRDGALQYSLAVYTAPDASLRPLSAQRLFASSSHNFLPGTHTMSVAMPSCGFFQVDLVKGGVIAKLNDSGNSYAPQGRLITAIGGGSACPAPAPAQPSAPAQPTVINNTNENTNVNAQEQTQTVNTTPAPAAPVAPAVQTAAPTELANTGPGSVAAIFAGVTGVSGLAYNLVMRRRQSA